MTMFAIGDTLLKVNLLDVRSDYLMYSLVIIVIVKVLIDDT